MPTKRAAEVRVDIALLPPRIDIEHLRPLGLTQTHSERLSNGQSVMVELPPSSSVICTNAKGLECKHAMVASVIELNVVIGPDGVPQVEGRWRSRFGRSVTVVNVTRTISDDVEVAAEGTTETPFFLAVGAAKEISGPLGTALHLSTR